MFVDSGKEERKTHKGKKKKKRNLVIKSLPGTQWVPTQDVERWEMDRPGCLIFLEPVLQVENRRCPGWRG